MTHTSLELHELTRPLNEIHIDSKTLCEQCGLDIQAAESFSRRTGISLPWHDSSSPRECLPRANEAIKKAQREFEKDPESTSLSPADNSGIIGALAFLTRKDVDREIRLSILESEDLLPIVRCVNELLSPIEDTDDNLAQWPNSEHQQAITAALCWMVHDIVACSGVRSALKPELKKEFPRLEYALAQISELGVNAIKFTSWRALDRGVSKDTCNDLLRRCENTLYKLGDARKDVGKEFRELLTTLSTPHESDEGPKPFNHILARAFDDAIIKSGEDIAKEAALKNKNVVTATKSISENYKLMNELVGLLGDKLTSAKAWSDPIGVTADLIKTHRVKVLDIDVDLLNNDKPKSVLVDIAKRLDGDVKFVIPVDILFTRNAADLSDKEIADSLNLALQRDQLSLFTAELSQKNFMTRRAKTFDLIRDLKEHVGFRNIEFIDRADIKEATERSNEIPYVVVGGDIDPGKPHIRFTFTPPKDSENFEFRSLIQVLRMKAPILGNRLYSACSKSAAPQLAMRVQKCDHHGLNGFLWSTVKEAVGEKSLGGEQFPKADEIRLTEAVPTLTVIYTGKEEPQEEEEPEEFVDFEIDNEDANSDEKVGSSNKW